MDPSQRPQGSRPSPQVTTTGPRTPAPAAASVSAPVGLDAKPNFARISSRIQDGLSRRLERDQIMHDVVALETRDRFGPLATPAMAASVADSFRTDPALSELVTKLFAAAGVPA